MGMATRPNEMVPEEMARAAMVDPDGIDPIRTEENIVGNAGVTS